MLPYLERDFDGWPVTLDDLRPHYEAAARTAGIAGVEDELAEHFPLYTDRARPLELSTQARWLLRRLRRRAALLNHRGIFFGQSRLAVDAEACRRVGLCLTGCPYGAIYNSATTLERLLAHPQFRYRPGLVLESIEEPDGRSVKLTCRTLAGGERVTFGGSRVFLACGVVSTLKVILASCRPERRRLSIRYHPYFLQPMLLFRNAPKAAREPLHTLAQVFVEIMDPRVSRSTVHLQVYTYNDMIRQRVMAVARGRRSLEWLLARHVVGRLMALQGYLSSDEGEAIEVETRAQGLVLRGELGARGRGCVTRVLRKLAANARALGGVPVLPLLEIGVPGEGNHIGCLFPMKRDPGELETDGLGTLRPFRRTHVVDASVLPRLPATTVTFTIMANAHRIGTLVGRRGEEGA
jgi:choline dehydrogenase-like flavoprotein